MTKNDQNSLPEAPFGLAGLPAGDAGLSGLVGKKADDILLSEKRKLSLKKNL
jgi:hypothetical protein